MDYWFAVRTTANTSKANLVKTELKLSVGIITQAWLFHPEGCHGLAYAAIFEGGHQLYPTNPEDAYHGNSVPMIFEDNYPLKYPARLELHTWNLDDTYDHTVYVRVTVEREISDPLLKAVLTVLDEIKTLLTGRRIS